MKFIPVIHVKNKEQALRNAEKAFNNKVDGIFLINHAMKASDLLEVYAYVRLSFKDEWIGINFLDLKLYEIPHYLPITVNGLWTDDSGIYDDLIVENAKELYFNLGQISYFGGIAFKHQPSVDYKLATKNALPYVDKVTTSGPATGIAPELQKIIDMKKICETDYCPLAVASGLTPNNINLYKPYVDYALVATGISKDFYELDEEKIRAFKHALDN